MKLLATHTFNCIVLMVKFGRTSCEDIPPALYSACVSKNCGMIVYVVQCHVTMHVTVTVPAHMGVTLWM